MKTREVTIRDLAIRLNISISTVSRALRDAADINPETKREVLDLAQKLNYEPNRIAQSLRSKSTKTIGVLVPEISLYFFSTAISGIQEAAAEKGYSIMICQSMESLKAEKENMHMLVSNRVDGIMMSVSGQTDTYAHILNVVNKNIPVVLFDRVIDIEGVSKVTVDDYQGSLDAVTHLVETGCKRIAYIGGPRHLNISQQRERGYRDAIARAKQVIDESLVFHCNLDPDEVQKIMNGLLDAKHPPDALFCFNDPLAIRALTILKERNIRVPDEISIVGFTDEPIASLIEPSLTTVAQQSHHMGRKTFEVFHNQIVHPDHWEVETHVIPTRLIKRNTTRHL